MDLEKIKKYEEMREHLLILQANLDLVNGLITNLRTELLSLINSERKKGEENDE